MKIISSCFADHSHQAHHIKMCEMPDNILRICMYMHAAGWFQERNFVLYYHDIMTDNYFPIVLLHWALYQRDSFNPCLVTYFYFSCWVLGARKESKHYKQTWWSSQKGAIRDLVCVALPFNCNIYRFISFCSSDGDCTSIHKGQTTPIYNQYTLVL